MNNKNSKLNIQDSKLDKASRLPGQLKLRLILFAIALLIASIFYREALNNLSSAVIHREGSSHGIFVPFLSAFFLWTKRDSLIKSELKYDLLGIPVIVLGIILTLIVTEPCSLRILEFIIVIAGLVLLLFGKRFFKEVSFPLFFLITIVPIPDDIYRRLAEAIRVVSFGGARLVISILGIPFYHDENFIQLHNARLLVAISCSGIRYLVSYFVFSLAYAYLFKTAIWSRIAVVISSIFISLLASVGRLSSIFILTHYISPKMAEHGPHILISWCVFFIVLIVAISLDQHFQKRLEKTEIQNT